jgi:hypothetical protein
MTHRILIRRDNRTDAILPEGTVVWDQDNLYLRVHDGVTAGGRAYAFSALGSLAPVEDPTTPRVTDVDIRVARDPSYNNVANYAGGTGEVVSSPNGQLHFFTTPESFTTLNAVGYPFAISQMQGTTHGYISGGFIVPGIPSATDVARIEKYQFAASVNGAVIGYIDDGTFPKQKGASAGTSSSTHGYNAGGYEPSYGNPGFPFPPGTKVLYRIDKFPFSSDTDASVGIGDLAVNAFGHSGTMSTTHGYYSGGFSITNPGNTPVGRLNNIQKVDFSSDTDASDIANLSLARQSTTGHGSSTDGYVAGGQTFGPPTQDPSPSVDPYAHPFAPGIIASIDKWPFASDVNSVANFGLGSNKVTNATGLSSFSNGYVAGGNTPNNVDRISKWPFSSDSTAVDIAEISTGVIGAAAGANSEFHGYIAGGIGPAYVTDIRRFPFASDSNALDTGGELTKSYTYAGSHQV